MRMFMKRSPRFSGSAETGIQPIRCRQCSDIFKSKLTNLWAETIFRLDILI
uniref:Uncharacterized protein n=1 Tax=Anguilla anguilla TaxID=7936 RepID=A0A0E9S4C1_ANGAN